MTVQSQLHGALTFSSIIFH